jgi:ATP-dependent Clp endopeptidase proteolytic subunit ClpP
MASRRAKRAKPQAKAGRPSLLDQRIAETVRAPGMRSEAQSFKRPEWARFEAFAFEDNSTAVIDVYDVIGGWELNAQTFKALLKTITAPKIQLNINSPGGSVFDAFAMFDDLRQHPAEVHVRVTGLAASAASLLAMAGDTIEIADNGFLMIHNAWNVAVGDKAEMTSQAKLLGQIDTRLAKTYAARTGQDVADIVEMMDSETWLDAEDATRLGFADEVGDVADAKNLAHDLSSYSQVPGVLTRAARTAAKAKPSTKAQPSTAGNADLVAALARLTATLQS